MTCIDKRTCCSLQSCAAVTAAALFAQSSTTAAQTLAYTNESAQESLVHKFFFGELVVFHAKANELTAFQVISTPDSCYTARSRQTQINIILFYAHTASCSGCAAT